MGYQNSPEIGKNMSLSGYKMCVWGRGEGGGAKSGPWNIYERREVYHSKITANMKSVFCNSAVICFFFFSLFHNNSKDLDPSYKMDLDI